LQTSESATKIKFLSIVCSAIVLMLCALTARHGAAQVEHVDPTIGNVGILLVPTRPAVYLPNSMVRVYPMRADAMDDRIESFPLTISSHRQPELFSIMPGDGKPAAYDQEQTTPYYYSVRFDDSLIRAEFSPTERCGYFHFSFPKGHASAVLANRQPGSLHAGQHDAISGEETVDGLKAYVFGEFTVPVTIKAEGTDQKGRLVASASQGMLEFRYGISFISAAQAEKNLRREIPAWGFDSVKDAAKARSNER
jgi:putative alpha-1,2-mannosidase